MSVPVPAPWTIRKLSSENLPAYRTVRLDALRLHPRSYGSSYEEESEYTLDTMGARWPAAPGVILGGFVGDRLAGIAGMLVEPKVKTRHKGFIYTVYVDQAFRGRGLAAALVEVLIATAREAGLRFVTLTVAVGNDGARRIYQRMGFRPYGIEPRGLLVDGEFVDEEMMVLDLD
jgi:ribosomal protein S18 acetylase RimI-like enzyme